MIDLIDIRTVPYGNILIELVLNYDSVHTTHGVIRRHFAVTAEIVSCSISAAFLPYNASRMVLPFNFYGLSEPLNVFQKFNTNFPRPYAIGRRKDTVEKFNSLHK